MVRLTRYSSGDILIELFLDRLSSCKLVNDLKTEISTRSLQRKSSLVRLTRYFNGDISIHLLLYISSSCNLVNDLKTEISLRLL